MTIDGEDRELAKGSVVYIPPFSRHALENLSSEDSLVMLSVWWEPRASLAPARPRRALITSAPPTPNGALHVGHLSGPYVAADVLRRYLEMRGVETSYLSGSDDHQSYVAAKGLEARLDAVADGESLRGIYTGDAGCGVDARPDHFLRPHQIARSTELSFRSSSPDWSKTAPSRFSRESLALYCESCEQLSLRSLCQRAVPPPPIGD